MAKTTGRVIPYSDYLREWMTRKIIARAEEVEKAIFDKFSSGFTPDDNSVLPKTGIVKWRNDVHWARARLTDRKETITLGDWFILLPPKHGNWDNHCLVDWLETYAIICGVAGRLPK